MKKFFLPLLAASLVFTSCVKDQMSAENELDTQLNRLVANSAPNKTASYYVLPNEEDLDNIPQDPLNPLTKEKVELGKLMFFDTGLAMDAMKPEGMGTYSCSSCHIPSIGFRPGNFQGIADGGVGIGVQGEARRKHASYEDSELDVQSARPLSLVNVAFVENTFWNGQFGSTGVNEGTEDVWHQLEETELNFLGMQGIETQNIEGLKVHRIAINKPLLDEYGYTELFDNVFADVPAEERYTIETASLAYSAYIRSIISNQAPFQNWLKGDFEAMTRDQKEGGILFFGKAKCSTCHYQENLGSLEFHALGVKDMYQTPSYNAFRDDRRNLGRGGFTLNPEDNYKFKVPGLYNLDGTGFFFHGSSATSIEQVVEYKAKAQRENEEVPEEQMSEKFLPLELSDEEKSDLVKFLQYGLKDPDLDRYAPSSVLSGFCFPNADFESRVDLGCD